MHCDSQAILGVFCGNEAVSGPIVARTASGTVSADV